MNRVVRKLALLLAFLALAIRRDRTLVVAALALAAAADWDWQLPAAALPALIAAGAAHQGHRLARSSLPLACAALIVGLATGLHGLGAALLESGRPARARVLLPGDARPDAALRTRAAFERGCRLDAGEPALRYEAPTYGGCRP